MKKLLLVGGSADALEAKRVVLEGAGYAVRVLVGTESVRRAAEDADASLIVIDVSSDGPDVGRVLEGLCDPESPSSIPVVAIGGSGALGDYDGPCRTVRKPAEKRALLESARALLGGARKAWARKRKG